jgi:uncharacterized protein
MPLLIDGHNVIGQMRDLHLSDPHDEVKLIERIKRFALKTGKAVTLIFDPNPNETAPSLWPERQDHGKVQARWAQAGQKADDVIRALVGDAKDRRGLTVITSDGALVSYCRACGVKAMASSEFIKELETTLGERFNPEAKPENVKPSEIDEWLQVFKEPETSRVKPLPFKDPVTAAEEKRKRRMEQLRKQTRGGNRLT